jgi:hypothetical protein
MPPLPCISSSARITPLTMVSANLRGSDDHIVGRSLVHLANATFSQCGFAQVYYMLT